MDDVAGDHGGVGVDFSDEKKAISWLNQQSVNVRCGIASRAALRVCSLITSTDKELGLQATLSILRAILLATVQGHVQNSAVEKSLKPLAESAALAAANTAREAGRFAAGQACRSSAAAARASDYYPAYYSVKYAEDSATASTGRQTRLILLSANKDAQNATGFNIQLPIWEEGAVPKAFQAKHRQFISLLNESRSIWGFWHDWYIAMWEGRFTEWDLAIEVAKIPNDVWEKGAEAVAVEIERIKARRALEAEIAALKEQLKKKRVIEQPHHRLHNNPPEAIESQQHLKSEITLIWGLLEDAETEVAKPAPSPSALRVIAETLWEISLRIGKYCASLADVALKKSAEVIGETGTKAGIAVFVTNTAAQNEGVKAVVKALWEFLKTLPAV